MSLSIKSEDALYFSGVKVMRFGYELFSPVIPTDSTAINDSTAAVNPQDIIITSNKDKSNIPTSNESSCWFQLSTRQKTILFKGSTALTIGGPNCFIETVRSPYSSLGDKFFSTTTNDKNLLPNPISLDESSFNHGMLPSSAISQSEIIFDENPLGFFDENVALVEQQHFSSGITSFSEPTLNISNANKSNGLVTTSVSFLNSYDEEDDASSVGTSSIGISEQDEKEGFSILVVPQTVETRLIKLIQELNNLIKGQLSYTKYGTTFRKIKKEHKYEIKCALDNDHVDNSYHAQIKRLCDMANNKMKTIESNRNKRKRKDVEEEKPITDSNKKSRKNYNSDTIDVLMDWYLVNHGKPPSHQCKKELAEKTAKTDIQSK
jgi:hypothetical protein